MILYYNPNCSKCRSALQILNDSGAPFETFNVLERLLSENEIKHFYSSFGPDLLRRKVIEEAGLVFPTELADVVSCLQTCPQAMERPILVKDEKIMIARPAERVREFLTP